MGTVTVPIFYFRLNICYGSLSYTSRRTRVCNTRFEGRKTVKRENNREIYYFFSSHLYIYTTVNYVDFVNS